MCSNSARTDSNRCDIVAESMRIDAVRCEPMQYLCEIAGHLDNRFETEANPRDMAAANRCESVRIGANQREIGARNQFGNNPKSMRHRSEATRVDAKQMQIDASARLHCRTTVIWPFFWRTLCHRFSISDSFSCAGFSRGPEHYCGPHVKGSPVRTLSDELGSLTAVLEL